MSSDHPQAKERHYSNRIGWLRAAVLGANDGILSTAGLMVGVAGAQTSPKTVLLTGLAGLVAGALSMAAGEYVSVSSQADTEAADLRKEKRELKSDPEGERRELAAIYIRRGLDKELALQVADKLMAKDALAAHAQDELGISEISKARPVQAAIASALSFSSGAVLPILSALFVPASFVAGSVSLISVAGLGILGAIGAHLGGAPRFKGAARVIVWGVAAMAVTYVAGRLFGAKV